MIRIYLISIAFIIAASLAGCSGGSSPVTPNPDDNIQSQNIPVSDSLAGNETLYPGVFGAWKVQIDTESLTAEIIPSRKAGAIGTIFDADLSQFLTVSPCANCLKIPGILLDSYEDLNLRIQIKHPFGDLNKRPDLHGFDVRAIFIEQQFDPITFADVPVMKPDGTEEPASLNSFFTGLLNADGYTSHFDSLVNDDRWFPGGVDVPGNLNPFLRFFESYTTDTFDPKNPKGHNVMAVGAGFYERVAVFDKKALENGLTFYVIADVAYGQSAVFSNRTSPQYYLPAFNRTEPWRVEYWMENNSLSWMVNTSTADVVVQVYDWQHGFSVDPAYPNPANLAGLHESSNVAQVELSVPDMMNSKLVLTTPESGTGTPTDPLQYRFTITNEKTFFHETVGLIAVRDEQYGVASPGGRIPIPASPAGFPYETEDIRDYAIYYPVLIYLQAPAGSIFQTYEFLNHELYFPTSEHFASSKTTLHPLYFSDLGHKKYQYKWDFDYDGVTFDIDGSGLPSPEINFTQPGLHNIGLRVRTNSRPVHESIYTIPVYSEGVAWSFPPFPAGASTSSTSPQGQHSVAMTADKLYAVSTRELYGQRNIWISVLERRSSAASYQVAFSGNPAFNPSICVIEDGANAGVYIAYVVFNGGENYIYFTKGDLDGLNFTTPIRITSNADNIENYPIIEYFNSMLRIYYIHTTLTNNTFVYSVSSDNLGDTWTEHYAVVPMGSQHQTDHAISIERYGNVLDLVWSDDINDATSGLDLYLAYSNDGETFFSKRSISSVPGLVDEYAASLANGREEIAIAYLTQNSGDPKSYARLKIVHDMYGNVTDWGVDLWEPGDMTFTRPCVAVAGDDIYLMGVGLYDQTVHTLDSYLLKIEGTDIPDRFFYTTIINESAGTIEAANDGGQIYPCLTTYKKYDSASEGFFIYRNFADGYFTSPTAPLMVFGDFNAMYFVADGAK